MLYIRVESPCAFLCNCDGMSLLHSTLIRKSLGDIQGDVILDVIFLTCTYSNSSKNFISRHVTHETVMSLGEYSTV